MICPLSFFLGDLIDCMKKECALWNHKAKPNGCILVSMIGWKTQESFLRCQTLGFLSQDYEVSELPENENIGYC